MVTKLFVAAAKKDVRPSPANTHLKPPSFSLPARQPSKPASQHASNTASQHASKTVSNWASQASQQASRPTQDIY